MGVPAFYRWISEKYPKIVVDVLEKRQNVIDGTIIPLNLNEPNPNDVEFDNLYVDMNGLIHPCSHPEDREAPCSEKEMYENITKYLDRLVSAVRPRRLLFLAIDGVAPRAKMNQQRSRRFRAAQDAQDRKDMLEAVVNEMLSSGHELPEPREGADWDSNVITPGTHFMAKLSEYMKYYILDRMNNDPFWKNIKVIISDASEPGEGEHKIMNYIRCQRNQMGFDPNQHHILHGLDADLIMLALATHEAHFTILREKVSFGTKRERDQEGQKSQAQQMLESEWIQSGGKLSALRPQDEWVYSKPLQALHVYTLREYLLNEFNILMTSLSFPFDLERVIDDFIFLCFFVGNDFLPHLPSLDIRDGALDFLIEVYKELLPSLGDYITSPGGNINLAQADIILGKVGEIEDLIFLKRKECEDEIERKREMYKGNNARNSASKNQAAQITQIITNENIFIVDKDVANKEAAMKIREKILGTKRNIKEVDIETTSNTVVTQSKESVIDEVLDDLEEKPIEPIISNIISTKKTMSIREIESTKEELKRRIKEKEQQMFDQYKLTVSDDIKLHESGWKDRYYNEKHKKENIEKGGGLKRMCYTYVQGLCWVLKYYYEGVPSWNWYYPFHYAPFASDLVNIDSYGQIEFEKAEPFRPVEQLLAVLPSNSVHALPEACRWLMTEESSPIIDLYDADVPIDPNGKHLPWLWILLLPFVDETRISAAFNSCKSSLSLEERHRNAFGCSIVFTHRNNVLAKEILAHMPYNCGEETDQFVCEIIKQPDISDEEESKSTDYTYSFDPVIGNGASGLVKSSPPKWFAPLDTLITAPVDDTNRRVAFDDFIQSNQVLSFKYILPPHHHHLSQLLPGVIHKPSILTNFDLAPKRPPRLNKGGFSILDLMNNMKNSRKFQSGGGSYNNSFGQNNNNYQQVSYPNTGMPSVPTSFFQNNQQDFPRFNNNNNNNYSNGGNNFSHNNNHSTNNHNFSNQNYQNRDNRGGGYNQYDRNDNQDRNRYDRNDNNNKGYDNSNRGYGGQNQSHQQHQHNNYNNNQQRSAAPPPPPGSGYNNNSSFTTHNNNNNNNNNNNYSYNDRRRPYEDQRAAKTVFLNNVPEPIYARGGRSGQQPPPPQIPYNNNNNNNNNFHQQTNRNFSNNYSNNNNFNSTHQYNNQGGVNQNQSSMQSIRDQLLQTLSVSKKK